MDCSLPGSSVHGLSRQEYWSGLPLPFPNIYTLVYMKYMNWSFWTLVLEKTLECPLDCKEIQQVHLKGNQSWVFIGRTDGKAETPILWPPDGNNWLIWKDPDQAKTEGGQRRERQRMRWLDDITDSMDMSLSQLQSCWWTGRSGVLQSMGSQRVRHDWTETELIYKITNKYQHKELHLIFYKKSLKRNMWVCVCVLMHVC